jgi:hypothetical protein
MKTYKQLWISVIIFSVFEWLAVYILAMTTDHVSDVVTGLLVIAFIIYPLYFIISLIFLPKDKRKAGSLILLIPPIVMLSIFIINP